MEVKSSKSNTINTWKQSGVIYHYFDDLYEVYIKTMNCWHCNKEFTSTRDRHLDHNHETGAFRAILCHKCNVNDSYIKYPNGYDVAEHKKQKINCICGSIVSRNHIARHQKTDKHLNNMDKYMENVD
tara:strand:- start:167 stop:547 length:381 start_codon:yes stop_codon:yes gene_type:complete